MIRNKILSDIVNSSGRCEITTAMLERVDAIERDEELRINMWLIEEVKRVPLEQRHSVEKDRVYSLKKRQRFNYGIYRIIKTCC